MKELFQQSIFMGTRPKDNIPENELTWAQIPEGTLF